VGKRTGLPHCLLLATVTGVLAMWSPRFLGRLRSMLTRPLTGLSDPTTTPRQGLSQGAVVFIQRFEAWPHFVNIHLLLAGLCVTCANKCHSEFVTLWQLRTYNPQARLAGTFGAFHPLGNPAKAYDYLLHGFYDPCTVTERL
jgi:hypothetical protein